MVIVQIVNSLSNDSSTNPGTDPKMLKQYGLLGNRRVSTLIPNLICSYLNLYQHYLTGKAPSISEQESKTFHF